MQARGHARVGRCSGSEARLSKPSTGLAKGARAEALATAHLARWCSLRKRQSPRGWPGMSGHRRGEGPPPWPNLLAVRGPSFSLRAFRARRVARRYLGSTSWRATLATSAIATSSTSSSSSRDIHSSCFIFMASWATRRRIDAAGERRNARSFSGVPYRSKLRMVRRRTVQGAGAARGRVGRQITAGRPAWMRSPSRGALGESSLACYEDRLVWVCSSHPPM